MMEAQGLAYKIQITLSCHLTHVCWSRSATPNKE